MISRIAEVAKKLKGFTHVINVQGDEPLVDPATVTKLAKAMAASKDIAMITSASPFEVGDDVTNPNAVKVVTDRRGDALYFSRSPLPFAAAPPPQR